MDFDKKELLERYSVKKDAPPTYLHDIVRQICDYFYGSQDSKCVSMWLGIGKRVGAGVLLDKFKQVKSKGITYPGYLMACTKNGSTKSNWKSARK